MVPPFVTSRSLVLFPCLACACAVSGQEALRQSLAGEAAAGQLRRQIESAPYGFRLGDLKTLLEPSLALEYNDNILHSNRAAEDDFILRPLLNLTSLYPVGERNALKLSAGLGYEKFLRHSRYDHWLVQPGSELSFDLFVKDLRINLHERFSYVQDPGEVGAVSGVARYGGIYNTAGATLIYDLQDLVLSFGYDYFKFVASPGSFDYLDRDSHFLFARASLQVHPAVVAGLEAGGGPTAYDQPVLNDHLGYSIGPYVVWQVTRYVAITPRAGYLVYSFSDKGVFRDVSDYDAWYFSIELDHRLGEKITYSLSASREVAPSVYANLLDCWIGAAQVNWLLIRKVSLSTRFFYERGEETAWFAADQFDRVGFTLGIGYQLMKRMTTRLGYTRYVKDSDIAARDYDQNRVTLTLSYRF